MTDDDLPRGLRELYKALDRRGSAWLTKSDVLDLVEVIEEYADLVCELQEANDAYCLFLEDSPSELVH